MAPPSKWDDEEDSTPPSSPPLIATRRKFEDEEDGDEVLDSWEAAEDSEVEREKEKKAAEARAKAEAEAATKKKPRSQRIEEHREEQRRRREEADDEDDSSEEDDEDDAERRARLRRSEVDADLRHAEDLIGDIDLSQSRAAPKLSILTDSSDPTNTIDLSTMPLFRPATKTQFTELTNVLGPLLTPLSKKPAYSLWVQDFVKQLVKDLPSAEIKKVASVITAASNEKLKEEKAADKGGKKSKAAKTKTKLVADRNVSKGVDTATYAGDDLDDGDFM